MIFWVSVALLLMVRTSGLICGYSSGGSVYERAVGIEGGFLVTSQESENALELFCM